MSVEAVRSKQPRDFHPVSFTVVPPRRFQDLRVGDVFRSRHPRAADAAAGYSHVPSPWEIIMPRTAAELDVELESLKARVAKLEGDLQAEQRDHQRTQADFERWGNRAWQFVLAAFAAISSASLATVTAIILYFLGVKKP